MLLSLEDEFDVSLDEVDILTDPPAYELYKYTIPVMVVDGKIKLEARITREKLWRALAEGYGPKFEG